ncbi:MAG: class I SAM-dependent methyltransferase [Anaerolineae bacterium]|nr:class I SAM-dependent methyltransferase [Anaerolineae bacterium]
MAKQTIHNDTLSPRLSDDVVRRHVPCNLCGSDAREPFCPENGLGLVQCQQCGLVYVSPRPDAKELYALYGETYFHNNESGVVGYSNYIKDEGNIRKTSNRRLTLLERFIQPGRLLDVGCAVGFFIDEAHKRGWQVEGLDVSSFAVEYARDHFGVDAQNGSLTELDYEPGAYDMVTMWDVIEHVPDPKAYIERAAQLLRPGGIVALATPDVDSLPARLTGKRWVGYKLSEEHIYYFSIKTLSQMLEAAGFEVVDVRHVGKYVTLRLFLDRLGMYAPWLAKLLELGERAFKLSEWALYINPFDIVAITARKK